MDFCQICHKPTSGLSDLKSHTTCYHCRRVRKEKSAIWATPWRTVQVPHHVTTQPHLPTTPHHHYNHKNSLPRIMWKDGKKKSPYTCLFLCLWFLFIVLNEMSPLVSFLVGHVRNYFQKFVCMQTMSDQSMTFSETTKWGTIHLECGNSFTRSLSLEKHLAWTHGRLCHPPLLSLIWGQASSLVDLVWWVSRENIDSWWF